MEYVLVLSLHNVLRWVVLGTAVFALVRMFGGLAARRGWLALDRKAGQWLTISMDVQLVVGLLLYFVLSPITTSAFANMGNVMSVSALRFYVVEHILLMVVAVVLAHVGTAMARRAATDRARFTRSAIFYSLAVLSVVAAIPWDRPLLRLLS